MNYIIQAWHTFMHKSTKYGCYTRSKKLNYTCHYAMNVSCQTLLKLRLLSNVALSSCCVCYLFKCFSFCQDNKSISGWSRAQNTALLSNLYVLSKMFMNVNVCVMKSSMCQTYKFMFHALMALIFTASFRGSKYYLVVSLLGRINLIIHHLYFLLLICIYIHFS